MSKQEKSRWLARKAAMCHLWNEEVKILQRELKSKCKGGGTGGGEKSHRKNKKTKQNKQTSQRKGKKKKAKGIRKKSPTRRKAQGQEKK